MGKTKLVSGLAAILLAWAGWGCTTYYDDPNSLSSFQVTLSTQEGEQATGSMEERLTYVAGQDCGEGAAGCPAGQECLGYCTTSGLECMDNYDCTPDEACAKVCAMPVLLDIKALDREGKVYSPQNKEMWVNLSVHPGFIPPSYTKALLVDGKATGVLTYIARAVGESHIWVEDKGIAPKDGLYGQCNDNKDNDGDGWIDMADPGCQNSLDDTERDPSYATGLGPAFFFDNPMISHVQKSGKIATSPLEGEAIHINSGKMVVTNTSAGGFFITDLTEPEDGSPVGYFNSIFMYTFSKPVGVRYGDTVCSISGGVVEYQGNTQLKFPSFEILTDFGTYEKDGKKYTYGKCSDREIHPNDVKLKVPDPVDVTDLLTAESPMSKDYRDQLGANSAAMEPYESGLITVRDMYMSTRFLACDKNENGEIENGSDEDLCRDECQNDPNCTQLESYFKYNQTAIYAGVGKKFYLSMEMLKNLVPLEIAYIGQADQAGRCMLYNDEETGEPIANPHMIMIGETRFIEYICPPMVLESVTGNYRQTYLCPTSPGKKENCTLQLAMLIPRFDEDIVMAEEEN